MILGTSAYVSSLIIYDLTIINKGSEIVKFKSFKLGFSYNLLDKANLENTDGAGFKLLSHDKNHITNLIKTHLEQNKSLIKDWVLDDENLITDIDTFNTIESIEIDYLACGTTSSPALVNFVDSSDNLDVVSFKNWNSEFKNSFFIGDDFNIQPDKSALIKTCREVEKMSKSKYNVVNPDDICNQYGADTLRMYEMFLGPLEQAKPWNTAGITGVHSFLKKLWKLYHSGAEGAFQTSNDAASKDSLKTLHKTIKKVADDIENFSFNTSVSTFMIAVNELTSQKCIAREVLEPLLVLISPYAPHIAEELWSKMGHTESISNATFPIFDAKHLVESSKEYPISFNGKMRFKLELPLDLSKDDIEAAVMAHEKTQQYLEGRTPKKVIVVPGKIVNVVG